MLLVVFVVHRLGKPQNRDQYDYHQLDFYDCPNESKHMISPLICWNANYKVSVVL
jgi:hypothetical protein